MNWLMFVFALEAGILPTTHFMMYEPTEEYVSQNIGMYVELEATIEAFGFYLGGSARTYMHPFSDYIGFSPNQMTYLAELGWRSETIDVGFRHYCMHPVVPFLGLNGPPRQQWEGWYEEIFVRFDGRVPLLRSR